MCTFPVPTAQHTRPIVAPFVSPTGRGWCLWRDEWRTGPGETEPRRLELVAPVVAGPAALSEGVFTVAPDANIPYNVGLHLFQLGVSPDFNHPRNRRGGHFAIRIPDHTRAVQQWWTVSVALLLGTYPDPSRVVLGVSLSRKPAQSAVKVWVAEGSHAAHQQQRDDLAAFLQLPTTPPLAQLEFCPHPCIRSMLRKKHAAQRGAARGLPHPQCGAEAALPHPSFPGPGTQYHYHRSPPADAWPTGPSSVAPVAQAQYYYHPTTLTPTSPGQSDGYYNYSYSPVDDADPVPLVREPVCRFVLPAHSPLRKIITCDAPAYEEGGMEAAETSHQHQQQYT